MLNKALLFYDMKDVVEIILGSKIQHLKHRLDILFEHQTDNKKSREELSDNPLNNEFITSATTVTKAINNSEWILDAIDIKPVDLINSFRDLDEALVHQSNRYYAIFGTDEIGESLS